jgi:ParB-like chromosome segregation protein Spo0J
MAPDRRRKLLRILAIPQDVQQNLQQIEITEAAVRALGRLEPEQQRIVTGHLLEHPELARSVRRIARAVHEQNYSVDDAIAEAEGRTRYALDESSRENEPYPDAAVFDDDQEIADAVLRFLETANWLMSAHAEIQQVAPDLLDIPEPWRAYYQQSLTMLEEVFSAS